MARVSILYFIHLMQGIDTNRYIRSKTIISRGVRDRIAGADYVSSSDTMLDSIKSTYKVSFITISPINRPLTLLQVPTNLALSNLFSGSTLLNVVFTSRYFQPQSDRIPKICSCYSVI